MTGKERMLKASPAAACAVAGTLLFQFWGNATHGYIATKSLFYWWGFQWVNGESETQHAWLILALSLYMLRRNLRDKRTDGAAAAGAALTALVFGLLLHAVGFIAQQPRVSIVALLVYFWGVLALGGGPRWRRASAFPIAFMVFAIPVNAMDTIGFWLQMGVVRAGAHIAHLVGIGVLRNGTQLFAPDGRYQYDVVAACSGIRSLMALTALSLFIGYISFRPAWLRAAMLLLSFPLVYIGNVLRISTIIVAAQWGGQAWGDRMHAVMGFGVFIVVVGGVIAAAEAVGRRMPQWTTESAREAETQTRAPGVKRGQVPLAVAVVFLAAVDGLFLSHLAALPPDESRGVILSNGGASPTELPTYLGMNWMGHRVDPEPVELAILPPDTGFSRKFYVNLDEPSQHVLLSIVLSGRDRTSIHRPELCVVAQGWTLVHSSLHHFAYPGRPDAGFDATVLSVRHDINGPQGRRTMPNIIAYWFVGDERIVASQATRMFCDAWSRLAHGRAPRWAYVYLQTDSGDGEEAGLARIQSILSSALPSFQPAYPPDRPAENSH
jgi:exosortase